ncbi:hypothetical protein NFI96_003927 [Prochilodus magdalenae]|nr:hypothetical protein NFI96_003927 [Prochilodus magdalenae]
MVSVKLCTAERGKSCWSSSAVRGRPFCFPDSAGSGVRIPRCRSLTSAPPRFPRLRVRLQRRERLLRSLTLPPTFYGRNQSFISDHLSQTCCPGAAVDSLMKSPLKRNGGGEGEEEEKISYSKIIEQYHHHLLGSVFNTITMAQRLSDSSSVNDLIKKSHILNPGPPALYSLYTTRSNLDENGRIRKWTFGQKCGDLQNKTILMVGETGTGKTTLINTMVNCFLGVKFEEKVWFEITEEKRDQSETQTSVVTVYEIISEERLSSLTIIDTPGYGHSVEIAKDMGIARNLRDLFLHDAGVKDLDAVCLVLKSNQVRISDRQRYIFEAVLSLFGKDIEDIIVLCITHSDGGPPTNDLESIKKEKVPCCYDEDAEPVHFLFNNRQSEKHTKKYEYVYKSAWEMAVGSIAEFFEFLKTQQRKSVTLTVGVLNERMQLEACVKSLKEGIKFREVKQNELTEVQKTLEENKEKIKEDEKIPFTVPVPYKEKVDITGASWWDQMVTSCNKCQQNCHEHNCWVAVNAGWCEVMNDQHCTVCGCPDSDHVRERRKYVTKLRQETVTFKQLKRKYSDANQEKASYDEPAFKKVKTEHEETLKMKEEMMKMESNLKTLLAENEAQKKSLVRDACMSILKLSEIALKPDSAFTIQHLDFLIPRVEEAGTAEWAQKLKDLQRAAASQESTNSVVGLRNASSPAHDLIRKSHMLSPGPPTRYCLCTTRSTLNKEGKIRKWTFGQRYANTQNKTILMVGETGTGKTTLINTMVNYFLGVKFEDKVWFEITEEEKRDQTESQTSEVTVYEIISEERLSSLTIIDTPGYGDTRGIERDMDIARNLHDLFLHGTGVKDLDAVCLVLKASQNRISERQRYSFEAVLSLFGKDIEDIIVLCITHSDGGPPTNALESIREGKIPCCHNEDEPVHFLFNNRQSEKRTQQYEHREAKQNELTEVQEALKLNKVMTERDKKFPLTVTTVYKVKVDVTGASWRNRMVTSCGKCEKNCHEHGCWVARKAQRCKVMKDNWCTVCNCHYSIHVREGKKYVTTRREEKVTVEKLKNEYGSTRGEKASYDENLFKYLETEHKKALVIKEMIINLETGLETLLAQNEAQKKSLVRDACMSIIKLSEIALKPDSTFTIQYLDFLIPQVEEAGTAEWAQKLRDLQRAAASQESTNSAEGCLGRKGNAPPKESTDSAEGYTCWMNRDMQNAPPKESTDSAVGCLGRKGKDMQNAPPKESTDSAVGDAVECLIVYRLNRMLLMGYLPGSSLKFLPLPIVGLCGQAPISNLNKEGKIRKWTFGQRYANMQNITILMVGETGSGKTTLINTMVNYFLGVKFEDEVWFEITEEENMNQTQSKTSEVTVYEIISEERLSSLTIIDTPGYGDTRGIEKDMDIARNLHELFLNGTGVKDLDAVCLVLKASQNRVSDRQRYIFEAVLSLFGKDIEDIIVLCITHSDGGPPTNALESIKKGKVPCCYDDEDEPVYFLFNNRQSETRTQQYEQVSRSAWEMAAGSMEGFFEFLKFRQRRSVTLTVSVLNERMQLEACVESLKERIKFSEAKQNELTEVQKTLEQNKEKIEEDEKFPFTVTTVYKEKVDITDPSWWNRMVTSCGECQENCHEYNCWFARNAKWCKVMKDNRCSVCGCLDSKHIRESKKYVITKREKKVTVEKLKNKYCSTSGEEASLLKCLETENGKKLEMKEMMLKLEIQLKTLLAENEEKKRSLVRDACTSIIKLSEIALKPDSTFTIQYLDFLIPRVEEAGTAEWAQKLKDLQRAAAAQKSTNSAVGYLRNNPHLANPPNANLINISIISYWNLTKTIIDQYKELFVLEEKKKKNPDTRKKSLRPDRTLRQTRIPGSHYPDSGSADRSSQTLPGLMDPASPLRKQDRLAPPAFLVSLLLQLRAEGSDAISQRGHSVHYNEETLSAVRVSLPLKKFPDIM